MKTPEISIVCPNRNKAPFLRERLESIVGQTFGDWELIFFDGYSTDGSWDIARNYRDDRRIRYFQEKSKGLYDAWNTALSRAAGNHVYIATSDDTMKPDCLAEAMAVFGKYPEARVVQFPVEIIDEQSEVLPGARGSHPANSFFRSEAKITKRRGVPYAAAHLIVKNFLLSMTGLIFRRELLEEVGLFRTDLGTIADREWFIRLCLHADVYYLNHPLATFRLNRLQATRPSNALEEEPIHRAIEKDLLDRILSLEPQWGRWVSKIYTEYRNNVYMNLKEGFSAADSKGKRRRILKLLGKAPHCLAADILYKVLGRNFYHAELNRYVRRMLSRRIEPCEVPAEG